MSPLCIVIVGLSFAAAPPAPELMKKLAEQDARMKKVDAEGSFTLTSVADELASDGTVDHTDKTITRVQFKNGKQQRSLLKEEADGEDQTEQARKETQQSTGKSDGPALSTASPFSAAAQAKYHFDVVGPAAQPSFLRITFAPIGKASESLSTGEATVDPVAGEVVRLVQHPSEMPSHVNRIEFVLQFDEHSPTGRQLSKVSYDGEGGFLFIKQRFRGSLTYAYEQPPPVP